MNLATKPTSAQWTVEKVGLSEDGGNAYVLREVATGKTKKVSADGASTAVMEKLAKDKIAMLRRLADR